MSISVIKFGMINLATKSSQTCYKVAVNLEAQQWHPCQFSLSGVRWKTVLKKVKKVFGGDPG